MPGSECDEPRLPEGLWRKRSRQEFESHHQQNSSERAHDERRQRPLAAGLAGRRCARLRRPGRRRPLRQRRSGWLWHGSRRRRAAALATARRGHRWGGRQPRSTAGRGREQAGAQPERALRRRGASGRSAEVACSAPMRFLRGRACGAPSGARHRCDGRALGRALRFGSRVRRYGGGLLGRNLQALRRGLHGFRGVHRSHGTGYGCLRNRGSRLGHRGIHLVDELRGAEGIGRVRSRRDQEPARDRAAEGTRSARPSPGARR